MQRIVIPTADGSKTLYVPHLQEQYHSTYGAYNESQHIYIAQAYQYCTKPTPTVLEIGFGTGLNAMNTLLESIKSQRKTTYISIEKYPLGIEEICSLQYEKLWSGNEQAYFNAIHSCNWNEPIVIHPYFTIIKLHVDMLHIQEFPKCDVVYFDAFAPEKQPELWTEAVFARIYASMNLHGILTSYCVKGVVRRLLQSIGFAVEKIPGPKDGKREILRAVKND